MGLTRNDGIWAAAIAASWLLAGNDLFSPRLPPDNVAVLWLPNAVLAVAMLRRITQPAVLGVFALSALASAAVPGVMREGDTALSWVLLGFANIAECFVLALAANRFGGPAFSFSRPRNVALWTGATLAAATLSMLMAWIASDAGLVSVRFDDAPKAILHWILGDACAHLTLGALLVAATSDDAGAQVTAVRRDARRVSVMAAAVLATSIVAFTGPQLWNGAAQGGHPGYLGLLLPALMWTAFSYGPLIAAAASLLALAPGVAVSVNGIGPFAEGGVARVTDLQIMILALSGAALLVGVLGAAVREGRDKAAAADRIKTLFLSRVGHELRTPLNGVIGAADLLARDLQDAPAAQQDRLDLVRSSARTLAAVVEDLVEFAAIHREGVSVRPTAFEASRPFEDAAAIFGPRARWNNVTLRLALSGFDDLWIVSDPSRLRQVLFAVVANAVEATTEGEIVIEARAEPHAKGAHIAIAVRDTGPGMAPDQLERIFEPFVMGGDDRHRPAPGLGLGLAVAKETMEALGGAIRAESAPGEGATIHIALTVERARAPSTSAVGARLSALLAEDNPTNRIVLTAMLTALGFDVVAVETGAEALEAAGKRDFAFIIMDIQMPVMDGEEATERIRALESPRARTPIIVVTAHALAGDDRRYEAAGADRVLSKPVALAELADAISAVLR